MIVNLHSSNNARKYTWCISPNGHLLQHQYDIKYVG